MCNCGVYKETNSMCSNYQTRNYIFVFICFRFCPKWPLRLSQRLMLCWETSHMQRKSPALEDANWSDQTFFARKKKKKHKNLRETSLFAQLYTQLACSLQHYASSMCAYPFCAVNSTTYSKERGKYLSNVENKVIHCSPSVVQTIKADQSDRNTEVWKQSAAVRTNWTLTNETQEEKSPPTTTSLVKP